MRNILSCTKGTVFKGKEIKEWIMYHTQNQTEYTREAIKMHDYLNISDNGDYKIIKGVYQASARKFNVIRVGKPVNSMNFHVKHKKRSLEDFRNDRHRFSFFYNGKWMEAACYANVSVLFEDESIPEYVKSAVQMKIYRLIDKYEKSWVVPGGVR